MENLISTSQFVSHEAIQYFKIQLCMKSLAVFKTRSSCLLKHFSLSVLLSKNANGAMVAGCSPWSRCFCWNAGLALETIRSHVTRATVPVRWFRRWDPDERTSPSGCSRIHGSCWTTWSTATLLPGLTAQSNREFNNNVQNMPFMILHVASNKHTVHENNLFHNFQKYWTIAS